MASSTKLSTNNGPSTRSRHPKPSDRSAVASTEPSGASSSPKNSNDLPFALPEDSNNTLRAILDELLKDSDGEVGASGGNLSVAQKEAFRRLEQFKKDYFGGAQFIEIEALPEASRAEAARPGSNLHSSIQLSNLSTLVHLVLISGPDPSKKTRPSKGAENLKEAVRQVVKILVVSDSESENSLLNLVIDLERQVYFATKTDDPQASFSGTLASRLPSSSTRLSINHSLSKKFQAFQKKSIKLVRELEGDRQTLETKWKWSDVVAECKAWVREEADGRPNSLVQQAEDLSEDPQDENAQEEDEEEDSQLAGEGETRMSSIGSGDEGEEEQTGEYGTQSSRSEQNASGHQQEEESSFSTKSTRSAGSQNSATRASPTEEVQEHREGNDEREANEEEDEDEDDDDLDTGGMIHGYFSNSQDLSEQTYDNILPEAAKKDETSQRDDTSTTTASIGQPILAARVPNDVERSKNQALEDENGQSKSKKGIQFSNGMLTLTIKEKKISFLDPQPDAEKIGFDSQSRSQTQVQPRLVSSQVSNSNTSRSRSPSVEPISESKSPKLPKRRKTNDSSSDPRSSAESRREPPAQPKSKSTLPKSRSLSPLPQQTDSYDHHDFGGGGSQDEQLPSHSSSPAFASVSSSSRRSDPQPFASTSRSLPHASATKPSAGKLSSKKRNRAARTDSDSNGSESDGLAEEEAVKSRKGKGKGKEQRVSDDRGDKKERRKAKVPPRKKVVLSSSSSSSEEEEETEENDSSQDERRRKKSEEKLKAEKREKRKRAEDPRAITTRAEGEGNYYCQGRNGPGARMAWTSEEERLLLKLIDRYGTGWGKMIKLHGEKGSQSRILKNRTNMSLKDKAVNIKKKLILSGQPIPPCLGIVRVPDSKLTSRRLRAPSPNETDEESDE